MTSVCVVIVDYRTAALVERAVASLARERARDAALDIRVLVVDNASGDADELRAAIAAHDWRDWVTLIVSPENGGFAYGNNVAFAHAFAGGRLPDHFFLLNPDTEVRPGAVSALVEFLDGHPGAGLAGSSVETLEGEPWPYAYRFPSLWSELEGRLRGKTAKRLFARRALMRRMGDAAEPVDWVSGASIMIRREVIEEIGGMDEGYFLYFEEADFCRKARDAGWRVWYVPASRIMHVGGQSTGWTGHGVRPLPRHHFESRRRYFVKRHGIAYAMVTDALVLGASLLRRVTALACLRHHGDPPHFLRSLVRHSTLLPGNRTIARAREFRVSGRGAAEGARG